MTAQETTILKRIEAAVAERKSESAELNAVAGVLAAHGWVGLPVDTQAFTFGNGARGRLYVWEGTPAGDFALIAGPSVIGEIQTLQALAKAADEAGVVFAPGRAAELTDRHRKGMERSAARGSKAFGPPGRVAQKERAPRRAPRARAPAPPPTRYLVDAPAERVTVSRRAIPDGGEWMSPAGEADIRDEIAEDSAGFSPEEMSMLAKIIADAMRSAA